MSYNTHLNNVRKSAKDEYYTTLKDIEAEVPYHKEYLKGKKIYCNCDDWELSKFYVFFKEHITEFGLQRVVFTSYNENGQGKFCVINGNGQERNGLLKGNGSFGSEECLKTLDVSDVVITNPPFSRFIEFFKLINNHQKQYLIIGNKLAIKYIDIMQYMMKNEVSYGYTMPKMFITPEGEETNKLAGLTRWYTNLPMPNNPNILTPTAHYNPSIYPMLDNYNAINVNNTKDIPCDYDGLMAVPITYFDKHNPLLFEIVGKTARANHWGLKTREYTEQDSEEWRDLNATGVLKLDDGTYKKLFERLLIKRKISV